MSEPFEEQKRILQKYVESMPTFSPATAKIVQLSSRLDTPANEIVAAIRLDPVLTGKVLQLVNSAYFSLAQKVTSLNRALVYMGINTIKNLALSTAVMEAFGSKNKNLGELIKPTWAHSLATAVCAKGIAKITGVPQNNLEEYFIAGLLHDLGQIVLMQAFYGTNTPHKGNLTIQEERKFFGLDHGEVGANTLRRWKFSDELIGAVANYHKPIRENKLSYYIHVADAMAYKLRLNGEKEDEIVAPRPIVTEAWEVLGTTEAKVISELFSAKEQIEKAEVFLNIASSKTVMVETP